MEAFRHRLLRPRYLWPLAVGCGVAGLLCGRFGVREDIPVTTPAGSPSMAGMKDPPPVVPSPREMVTVWLEASEAAPLRHPVITITGRHSAQRKEAFRKLLAGMEAGNAADLYRMLRSGEALPDEEEWHAFMEKWGRLDGPSAAAMIGGDDGSAIPGLLRGWASVDPVAAKAWLEERLSAGEAAAWHAPAQRGLILGWLHADSGGAAEWLNDRWENPAYPEIAAAFADEVVAIDPANAMQWAGSVEGAWRGWALERVGRKWLEDDRPAATAALQAAGYAPEAIDALILSPMDGFDLLDATVPLDSGLPGVSIAEE